MVSIQSVWLLIYMQRSRFMSHFREKILPKSQKMLICCFCMKICSCYNLYAVPSLPFRFLVNYCMLASWSVFTFPSQTLSIMLYEIIDIRGGSRGGFVGFERTPLFVDSFDLLVLCYSASSVRHSALACQSSLATV